MLNETHWANSTRLNRRTVALVGVLVLFSCVVGARNLTATPILARPDLFKIKKYAEFTIPPLASFSLVLSDGSQGFQSGLIVGTGPIPDRDRLLFIDPSSRQASVLAEGFTSNEGLVFARGSYGNGLFVSEIADGKVLRLLPDKSKPVFSSDFTQPNEGLGPAQMVYGPDPTGQLPEVLYVTDFASGTVKRVNPDGTASQFAVLTALAKGLAVDVLGLYGGGFIGSTFNFNSQPFTGQIFHISPDGASVIPFPLAVTGLQLLATGNASAFDSPFLGAVRNIVDGKVFVPSIGLAPSHDGSISILNPNGTLSPFLSGIDASSIVFDTNHILGGGMFVTDVDGVNGEQTIYRIAAIPEPASYLLLGLGIFALFGFCWRSQKSSRWLRATKLVPEKWRLVF